MRVGLFGDSCVGKTSLAQLYASGGASYPREYQMVG